MAGAGCVMAIKTLENQGEGESKFVLKYKVKALMAPMDKSIADFSESEGSEFVQFTPTLD
jgi:hypothetical protein